MKAMWENTEEKQNAAKAFKVLKAAAARCDADEVLQIIDANKQEVFRWIDESGWGILFWSLGEQPGRAEKDARAKLVAAVISRAEGTLNRKHFRSFLNDQDKIGGRAVLHWAAGWNYLKVIKALHKAGANINVRDDEGITPMALAVVIEDEKHKPLDRLKTIELLLSLNADPNIPQTSGIEVGWTPIHWAIVHGNVKATEKMLEHASDVTVQCLADMRAVDTESARGNNGASRNSSDCFKSLASGQHKNVRDCMKLVQEEMTRREAAGCADPRSTQHTPVQKRAVEDEETVEEYGVGHASGKRARGAGGRCAKSAKRFQDKQEPGKLPKEGASSSSGRVSPEFGGAFTRANYQGKMKK